MAGFFAARTSPGASSMVIAHYEKGVVCGWKEKSLSIRPMFRKSEVKIDNYI